MVDGRQLTHNRWRSIRFEWSNFDIRCRRVQLYSIRESQYRPVSGKYIETSLNIDFYYSTAL